MSLLDKGEEGVVWGHNFLVIVMALFVLGFFVILGYLMLSEVITGFATSGHYSATAAEQAAGYLSAQRIFDYGIILIFAGMLLALIVTSYRVLAAPIFFVVTLVMGLFFGFVSYAFSYMFQEIMSNAAFAAVVGTFPLTIMLCTNLHWVGLSGLVVGSIALYAKRPKNEGVVG